MSDGPTPAEQAQLGSVGMAAGLGCSVVVSLIVLIGGGLLIDQAADTAPIFTLVGVGLGLVVAGYQLYELTRVGVKNRQPGPLARRLSHLPVGRRVGGGAGGTGRGGGEE